MRNSDVYAVVGVLFGLAATAYAAWQTRKMEKLAKKMNRAVDMIDSSTEVELSEELVNTAVQNAVDREARSAVTKSTDEAMRTVKEELNKEIHKAVYQYYDEIKPEIRSKIDEKIGDIDISEARREVIAKAKERVSEKFEQDLDGLLNKHNDNLDKVTKIYSSISDLMKTGSFGRNTGGISFN